MREDVGVEFDDDGLCRHGLMKETCGTCNGSLARAKPRANGSGSGPAIRSESLHLLVKWSPEREADTLDRHRLVAEKHGTTWWGCETADPDRKVAPARLDILNRQLKAGTPTSVFLYRLGDKVADARVYEAALRAVSADEIGVDLDRRPSGYEDSQCFLYLELADFAEVASATTSGLELYDAPFGRSLTAGALGNQTSPLYVVRSVPVT